MLDLAKKNAVTTDRLYVGVDWEGVKKDQRIKVGGFKFGSKEKKQAAVDLDLTLVVCNKDMAPVTYCDGDEMTQFGGALTHSPNSRDGKGEGDDEFATAVLSRLPSSVHHVVYALTAFDANNFGSVSRVGYTVKDMDTSELLVNEMLPIEPQYNAALLAKISRDSNSPGGWAISFYEGNAHLNVRTTMNEQQPWRMLITAAKNAGML